MKNALVDKIFSSNKQKYQDGFWDGMHIMLNLCAIALNRNPKRRFGDKRLTELEADVQALIDELIDVNDPLVNAVHIERAVKSIRGKGWKEE